MATAEVRVNTRRAVLELVIDTPAPAPLGAVASLLRGIAKQFERHGPTKRRLVLTAARQGSLILQMGIVAIGSGVAVAASFNTLSDFVKNIGSGFKAIRSGATTDESDQALGAGVRAVLAHGGSVSFSATDGASRTVVALHASEIPAIVEGGAVLSMQKLDNTWLVPVRLNGAYWAILPKLGSEAIPLQPETFLALAHGVKAKKAALKEAISDAITGRSRWEQILGQKVRADVTIATMEDGTKTIHVRRLGETAKI